MVPNSSPSQREANYEPLFYENLVFRVFKTLQTCTAIKFTVGTFGEKDLKSEYKKPKYWT